ncbi:dynein axonemal intermediate chain 4 [Rhinophrynus dorsalis]
MSGPTHARGKMKNLSTVVTMRSKPGMQFKKTSFISASGTQSKLNYSILNRSMMGTSSRKSISLHADSKVLDKNAILGVKQVVQVFDEEGKDVTPHALFQAEPGAIPQKQSKLFTPPDASGIASDIFSSISLQQTGFNASFAGPFTRSTFGGSSMSLSSRDTESMTEDIEETGFKREAANLSDLQVKQEELQEQLVEEDLDKIIDIYLTDTETIWLLDIPPMLVSTDSEEAELVRLQNQAYTDLCKNRAGNDKYLERAMQTFNGAPKSKEVQCDRIILEDAGVMASAWDMYDSINLPENQPPKVEVDKIRKMTSVTSSKSSVNKTVRSINSLSRGESASSSIAEMERLSLGRIPDETEADSEEILKSEKFQQDLFFMERVVVENIFQPKLAAYRQLPVIEDTDVDDDMSKSVTTSIMLPSVDRLWSFVCDMTKGYNVSSTSWNKKNPDILAVGYGQFGFKEQKGGLACCWSMKNVMWPERIFQCECGVTALDFSAASPNLLAVGMYNGRVAVYNVQNKETTPVLDSSDNPNKHTSPVWQLKWIEQDKGTLGEDKGETLVSICADGRITRWHIRKGLDSNDLMKLKRTGSERSRKSSTDKERKGEAFISRQAPGMCFDFLPKDTNIYLAGTEEGHIHKCSCSYNEQFLDTYHGHKGPVYKIAWSPFCSDVFLSCSADWCVHLWRQDILKPILTFSATTNAVHDIMWSPTSALVFGAVNENRVEIWDLGVSTLDPVIVSYANPGVKLTTILFAKNTSCVLIGDSDGQVGVYELRNISSSKVSQVNALYDIIGATLATQL